MRTGWIESVQDHECTIKIESTQGAGSCRRSHVIFEHQVRVHALVHAGLVAQGHGSENTDEVRFHRTAATV